MDPNNEVQSNAERFIIAFAKIEKTLNRITKRPQYVPFRLNARISARYDAAVKNHLEDICGFAELRNAIVHTRDGESEIVAEPSDKITKDIERIAELLDKDRNILQFASSPVIFGHRSDTIISLEKLMDDHQIDKMPLYDNGKFSGVVTLQQILHHIIVNGNSDGTADNILSASEPEKVIFLNSKSSLQTVVELFEQYVEEGKRAPMVLVTKNGGQDEEPLGLLTLYDLTKIVTYLS